MRVEPPETSKSITFPVPLSHGKYSDPGNVVQLIAQFCFKRNINREEYLEFDVLKNKFVRNLKMWVDWVPVQLLLFVKERVYILFHIFQSHI